MNRAPGAAATREVVVLVHGLWLSGWSMRLLSRWIAACGYQVRRFSYPTVRKDLHENALALRAFSDAIDADVVHYVGHSLGGIVIRAMFHYFPPTRPGRVVTICSPHGGSHVARLLSGWRWGRGILGKSIADLLAGEPAACETLGRDVGLIKGDLPVGLGRLFPGLPRPNDGVVALDEMALAGARDAVTLPVSHTLMLLSRSAARLACDFLRNGTFGRGEP